MAGRKRFQARMRVLCRAPPHSWVHAKHYSVGDPDNVVYFLCTPHGPLTINEEYYCWVYAATGRNNLARRMAYGGNNRKAITPKLRARVADLIDMDARGVIKLREGPWKYYGFEVGDPSLITKPGIKDYAECLMT